LDQDKSDVNQIPIGTCKSQQFERDEVHCWCVGTTPHTDNMCQILGVCPPLMTTVCTGKSIKLPL